MAENIEEQLTLFAAGSPVNHTPKPGSDEARTMTAHSGLRCYELYEKLTPLGSLVKTLLASKQWASTVAYLTWKVTGSQSKRLIFRLVESEPSIGAIDFGSLETPTSTANQLAPSMARHPSSWGVMLPTVTAQDYGTNQGGAAGRTGKVRPSLQTMARRGLLPTQAAIAGEPRESGHRRQIKLKDLAKHGLLPTVTAVSHKGSHKSRGKGNLTEELGGPLNPRFVEEMMGYPIGHTDLEHSETP